MRTCWSEYANVEKYKKLVDYVRLDNYTVEALNGLRPATLKEIENGVKELQHELTYPVGKEFSDKFNLLIWTMTGNTYYFRAAGFKNEFDNNGKVADNIYEMICKSSKMLNDMFNMMEDKEAFNKKLKILEKVKKQGGIKYAGYAKDEITEKISPKQLISNAKAILPRNSDNKDIRKAISICIKYSSGKRILPMDISFIRKTYDEYINNMDRFKLEESTTKLKEQCERILKEKKSSDFVYKIIYTLKAYNYSKCSVKQYKIIQEAYDKLVNTQKEIKDDNIEYEVISDLIGSTDNTDSLDEFDVNDIFES